MNTTLRRRLAALLAAVAALLLLVAMLAHTTWTRAVEVRVQFRAIQDESAQLAEHFHRSVQSLDALVLRCKLRGNPSDRARLDLDLDTLDHWLDTQRPHFVTAEETAQFKRIDTALERYAFLARHLADTPATGAALATELGACEQQSEALLGLGFNLASTHHATADDRLSRAARSLGHIQWVTFAALGLLVAAGCGISLLVYRDHIAPLRHQLDESLRRLERQEKLASLGVLSAGIAHEIRNPLTAIRARLFTLRKAVQSDASANEDATMIGAEIDRLDRIVRSFLQFARPPEPVLRAVRPAELLAHATTLADPAWAERGLRLQTDPVSAPPVLADAEQIAQALLNLLRNAAEASPDGGVIRLSARTGLQTASGRPAVGLEVSDDGPGIPADVQARLFDPFFSTKPNGTGLGLSLTARLLENHGGGVRCATAPGHGTTFSLLLPVANP